MGLYKTQQLARSELALVKQSRTYTLYRRSRLWYVNFSLAGKQYRLSTGCPDLETATQLVESQRSPEHEELREVDDQHLYRMIERARYKMRNKGVPFGLSIDLLREVAKRCGGYCEVTGHRLEDTGPFRPSLDRIVPELGYVAGNIRIVCLITNTGMLHYGEIAFAELAVQYAKKLGYVFPDPSQPST